MEILRIIFLVITFSSVPFLTSIFEYFNFASDYICSSFEDSYGEFDFIVIGAGSAGSPLVNRLSKNNKVLLLEAGGDPPLTSKIPGMAYLTLKHSKNLLYYTVPQENACLGMNNNQSFWPRGKCLGGSSDINYMFYVRANPRCYDFWANTTGDSNWSYDNLLPYFKKSIHYKGKFKDNKKHHEDISYGEWSVEARNFEPLVEEFFEAGKELGFDVDVDFNGPQKPGFGVVEVSHLNGARHSTYSAFLKNIRRPKKNLKISRYSQAIKIDIDSKGQAKGVWFLKHGKVKYAKAKYEIILSAGSIDSPKLLMLSGIGEAKHLKSVGIKPKIELPVGRNLHDHVSLLFSHFVINEEHKFKSVLPLRDYGPSMFLNYFLNGKGFLTNPNGIGPQAFISSPNAEKDWPNLQFYLGASGIYSTVHEDLGKISNYKPNYLKDFLPEEYNDRDGFMFAAILGRPKSRGFIQLKDKNPSTHPIIDPKYLSNKDDVDALVYALKFALNLGENTKAFKKLGAKYIANPIKGCESYEFRSDSYWECFVRHATQTLYHPVGTCKMSKENDPTGVVDSKLRVFKTKGLRVADASIMPNIVNANTNAPSVMIGEKAADLIREYWTLVNSVCDLWDYLCSGQKSKMCFYSKLF